MQELKATEQQVTDAGNDACFDSVDKACGAGESLYGFPKDVNKENLPHTLPHSERKPQPQFWARSKPENRLYTQSKSSLAPKQALGRRSLNHAALKDRANEQLVGETQARIPCMKSQQISRGAGLVRPGEKAPKTVPSHCVQTLRTQASKKPGVKNTKDTRVNRGKYERPGGAKLPTRTVTDQRVEHTRPRTGPGLLQGAPDSRRLNIRQDRKPPAPPSRRQASCVPWRSNTISQRPDLALGRLTSVTASIPSTRASAASRNEHGSYQQKVRTLDSKLKGAVPHNHFLSKTAPKTQPGGTAVRRRGVPDGTQTNPGAKRKTTAEDRRYLALVNSKIVQFKMIRPIDHQE